MDERTTYRRGSVIRQPLPHPGHPHGARRWRVLGVEGDDYYVQALFSDGGPRHAYWNIAWCEAATELEWQDDAVGRIDMDGVCQPWPSKWKAKERSESEPPDRPPDP